MSRPSRPTLHLVLCAVGLCLGVVGSMALAVVTTRAAAVEPGDSRLGHLPGLDKNIHAVASGALGGRDKLRIAVLGDSTVGPPRATDHVPSRLHVALLRRTAEVSEAVVYNLSAPAMGSVTYHFMVADIVDALPDLVVWQVAFTHTSHHWRRTFSHHEMAGRMRLGDLARLTLLPIHDLGLSADDLLLYKLLMGSGSSTAWIWLVAEQSRVAKLRVALEERLAPWVGVRPEQGFRHRVALKAKGNGQKRIDGRLRSLGKAAVRRQGDGLTGLDPSHITLRMLAESLRLFETAGIPVLVYLGPINIEHLRNIGVVDEEVLRESVDVYRQVVVENGAGFIDLHDALPDISFVDARGHYHSTEEFDAVGRMLDKILPRVMEVIERIAPRQASAGAQGADR
jgi:hypothetical protein